MLISCGLPLFNLQCACVIRHYWVSELANCSESMGTKIDSILLAYTQVIAYVIAGDTVWSG